MPPKKPPLKARIVGWFLLIFMSLVVFSFLLPEATQKRLFSSLDTLLIYLFSGFILLCILGVIVYVALAGLTALLK